MTNTLDTKLSAQLDALCDLFDEELERQENVSALCRAQGDAARARDLAAVEARTRALSFLIEDALTAEMTRVRLLRGIVDAFELPIEQQTLSHLIAVSPEPWRRRMQEFQSRMKSTLAETRATVRANAAYMRRSLDVVDEAIDLATGVSTTVDVYEADGQHTRSAGRPALINAYG